MLIGMLSMVVRLVLIRTRISRIFPSQWYEEITWPHSFFSRPPTARVFLAMHHALLFYRSTCTCHLGREKITSGTKLSSLILGYMIIHGV